MRSSAAAQPRGPQPIDRPRPRPSTPPIAQVANDHDHQEAVEVGAERQTDLEVDRVDRHQEDHRQQPRDQPGQRPAGVGPGILRRAARRSSRTAPRTSRPSRPWTSSLFSSAPPGREPTSPLPLIEAPSSASISRQPRAIVCAGIKQHAPAAEDDDEDEQAICMLAPSLTTPPVACRVLRITTRRPLRRVLLALDIADVAAQSAAERPPAERLPRLPSAPGRRPRRSAAPGCSRSAAGTRRPSPMICELRCSAVGSCWIDRQVDVVGALGLDRVRRKLGSSGDQLDRGRRRQEAREDTGPGGRGVQVRCRGRRTRSPACRPGSRSTPWRRRSSGSSARAG